MDPSVNYYMSYGEVQYESNQTEHRRYYVFDGKQITNNTIHQTLYSIPDDLAQSFQVTFRDHTREPYRNHYTALLRWYPDLNEYRIVEMGKTDDEGKSNFQVKVESVDYRLALYELDGDLVKLANPIRMVCQELPCEYTLTVEGSLIDLIGAKNVNSNIVYNRTTQIFTYTFNDPDQETSAMNLQVFTMNGDSEVLICNQTATGYTGVLTCDASSYNGLLKAYVYRSASPARAYDTLIVTATDTPFQGVLGMFITILLLILLPLTGVIDPRLTVVFGVLALIPALALGTITYTIMIAIGCMGGLVIHIMTRSNR